MDDAVGFAAPVSPQRQVSRLLGLGVLVLPIVFIWFLFRAGYSAKAQTIACVWMGLVGTALLVSAPNGPLSKPSAPPTPAADAALPIVTTILDAPVGSPPLALKLGDTTAVQRLLRTQVTLTNNTGADLKYAEVQCLFYAADGKLLGNGLGNWSQIGAGRVVSGQVVASNIDLAQVARRQCRARSL